MRNSFETSFIQETVEKTPFADKAAQNFFAEWCRINDSIVPEFITREAWEQRDPHEILEKRDQETQTLVLPIDLHMWEMMRIIGAIDHDTLTRTPEKREERADKIKMLGKTFEKAGLYLSEYLPEFNDGNAKKIAQNISEEFYKYGLSLQDEKKVNDVTHQEQVLSNDEKQELDKWFLGGDMYQKRLARLGESPTSEQIEEVRKKLLHNYFRALAREGHEKSDELPWRREIGPVKHLQDTARRQIKKTVETPEREMKTAIFRRGLEKLVTEMKEVALEEVINDVLLEGADFNVSREQRKLYDTLHINDLKRELNEVREVGDISLVSKKEFEIAQQIQEEVSKLNYKANADKDGSPDHPSTMLKTQYVNCVGASVLGGGLLDEVGIKYLHAGLPGHSATILLTTDEKWYWQDFTPTQYVNEINYQEIVAGDLDETEALPKLKDIPENGLRVSFNEWRMGNGKLRLCLFPPEIGLQYHILHNTGATLAELGQNEEAIEAYKQALSIDLKDSNSYNSLGNALSSLDRNEDAIEAYKRAIIANHEAPNPYNGLGNVLCRLDKYEEAIEAYKRAIVADYEEVVPYNGLGNALKALGRYEEAVETYGLGIGLNANFEHLHNGLGGALRELGRNKEALQAYRTFVDLCNDNDYWVAQAKEIIKNLEREVEG